jgi:hypothetical protein
VNITGSWRGKIYYSKPDSPVWFLSGLALTSLASSSSFARYGRIERHTEGVFARRNSTANGVQEHLERGYWLNTRIESRQRRDAALRKEKNEEWVPKYFVMGDFGGRSQLTQEGIKMLETVYAKNF